MNKLGLTLLAVAIMCVVVFQEQVALLFEFCAALLFRIIITVPGGEQAARNDIKEITKKVMEGAANSLRKLDGSTFKMFKEYKRI